MFSSPLPDMDFHSKKRKQLQALCKKHSIPANLTNLEMANNLASLLKEKGKLMIRGRSCMKGEPVSENDSNGVIRHLKKVRFNPENETIEFADSRVTRRRKTIAKPMVKKGELVIDSVDNIEASWRIGESQVRTTRTRGRKLVSGGVIEVVLPLADKKRKRMKGVISESAEGNDGERVGKTDLVSHLSDNLESESVDAEEIRMQARRSLRNRYVPITKNSDDVEKDCKVLKKNQTTLKKILETNAEISMDTGLGGECRIVQPVKAVRHSKRNIRKIEDYGLQVGIDPITSETETDQTEYSKEAGGRKESITKSHSLATDTDRHCFKALGTSTKEISVSELRLSGDDEMQEEEMRSGCNDVATVPVIQLTVVTEANHNDTCIKPSQEQAEMNQELSSLSLIKSKCQAAITAHTGGNPGEAFSLVDEMGRRYKNCGLVYAAQYKLHALEASRIKTSDGALFQKHVRSAVESARCALSLSPNSVEFWTFYAQALLKLSSSDVQGLDDVLRECERALSIENPLDHCRDASSSLKAMVWEERCESVSSRMSDRKKQVVLEEIVSAMVKMGKLRMYWNAMSEETKMGLIGPRIGDLRENYSSLCKDGPAKRVFSEGIGYAEKNKNWKFWPCYYCDEKFEHYEMRMKHTERKHEGVIGQNLQIKPYLFPEIDADGGGSEVYHNFQIVNGTIYIIKERIVLTGDSSCPLDDRLLRVEVMPHRHHDGVENGSASPCGICDSVVLPVPPDIDAFGQWLFDGPPTSTAEELASWTHLQHQMKHEGTEAPKRFKDEFNRFQALRSRQSELMVQCRCLQAIQIICAQELGKREKGREHVRQSYKSLLKEVSMSTEKISMLNTIMGVLTQAENNRHYPLESNEFEDQEDASIRMTIHQKLKPLVSELCRNEARITRCSAVMWRLSVMYKQASLDYRSIMLPLMRNSIHAKLEALIYGGEEKQKTDAATEALLSLLALDTKKNTSQGSSHSQSEILL